jgi:hypothetical protein
MTEGFRVTWHEAGAEKNEHFVSFVEAKHWASFHLELGRSEILTIWECKDNRWELIEVTRRGL